MANEKRLIDANELLLDNEKYFCEPCKEKGNDYHGVACGACWVDDMRIAIEDAPTVDAVQVVRCKNCKRYRESSIRMNYGWCSVWGSIVRESGFCHEVERREEQCND